VVKKLGEYSLEDFLQGQMPVLYHIKYDPRHGIIFLIKEWFDVMGNTRLRSRVPPKSFIEPISSLNERSLNFNAFRLIPHPRGIQQGRGSEFLHHLLVVLENALFENKMMYTQNQPLGQQIILRAGEVEKCSFCYVDGLISLKFRKWLLASPPTEVVAAEEAMVWAGRRLARGEVQCCAEIGGPCNGLRLTSDGQAGTTLGLHCDREFELDPGNMNSRRDQFMILAGLAAVYDEFRRSLKLGA
jgi:hypothetical protein